MGSGASLAGGANSSTGVDGRGTLMRFLSASTSTRVVNELVVRLPTPVGQVAEQSLDDHVPLQLSASCLGTCSSTFPVDHALLSFAPETT